MPDVTVVIPARNAARTLPDTLAGLESQDFGGAWEVVLVDDGSTDGTLDLARRSPAVTRVIERSGTGPALARNAGAAGGARLLAFLDADCRPAPRWLSAGVDALAGADFVLGEVRPTPEAPLGPFDRTLWVVGLSPLFESANLFVRRELFELAGGFESWLGPRGGKELGEDVLLGWRARRIGARIVACPEALAHHAVFPRGAVGFAAERLRLRFFPALVRAVPELRTDFLWRRCFLNDRSARFDLAAAGIAAAAFGASAATPRASRLAPVRAALVLGGLAAARPYAGRVREDYYEARGPRGRRAAVELALARIAADVLGAGAMAYGSARTRSLVI